ncbi:hypothetical protein [Victivallis sp. Marseille-Q1083]|uniref:hypothetical protein n=1 Tax=Victivallis sp. Marseille-Q1083 TaxID=2717288 RepID=UPI00158ED6C8|nr:hypothetical protein [Victivallis sp. Marseille-Q1083]
MLLGLDDWVVALAFYANVIAMLIGVIYGAINFNRGDDCDQLEPAALDNTEQERP